MQSGTVSSGLIFHHPLQFQNRNLQASINSRILELQTVRGIAIEQQANLSALGPCHSIISAKLSNFTTGNAGSQQFLGSANQNFQSLTLMCEDLRTKYESLMLVHENLKREKALIQHQIVRDAAQFEVASTEIYEIGYKDGGEWRKKIMGKEIEELKQNLEALRSKNRTLEVRQQDYDQTKASVVELRTKWVCRADCRHRPASARPTLPPPSPHHALHRPPLISAPAHNFGASRPPEVAVSSVRQRHRPAGIRLPHPPPVRAQISEARQISKAPSPPLSSQAVAHTP
jgi:hypothetical protein